MISAIEIYNKPDFKYREETFALLALNAWELLLKAKLLAQSHNNPRSIYQYDRRQDRNGKISKKRFLKKNRSGNPQTITLGRAITLLDNDQHARLNPAIKSNLDALVEIRDNAAHYVNASAQLAKQVLEIGTAAVQNYVRLTKEWFSRDLSRYNLFLMPLGFIGQHILATAISVSRDEKNLLAFLAKIARDDPASSDDYHVCLSVNLSFQKSKLDSAMPVFVTNDPKALVVNMTEEDLRRIYPWDYAELTKRLSSRYSDFVANSKYHQLRKPLQLDKKYTYIRLLDKDKPEGSKKHFYNPNIMEVFDRHYTKKQA